MSIVNTLETNNQKLEETALNFVRLVEDRNYKKAKEYYNNLNEEEQRYIQRKEDYSWKLKALSMSSM